MTNDSKLNKFYISVLCAVSLCMSNMFITTFVIQLQNEKYHNLHSTIKALTRLHNKGSAKALSTPNTSINSSIRYSTTHRIPHTVP